MLLLCFGPCTKNNKRSLRIRSWLKLSIACEALQTTFDKFSESCNRLSVGQTSLSGRDHHGWGDKSCAVGLLYQDQFSRFAIQNYSEKTAYRFGLFIGSILVVIGETSEFYLSSQVKGTYLTISFSIEKFRWGIKMWFWKYCCGSLNYTIFFGGGSYSSCCKSPWGKDIFERIFISSRVQVLHFTAGFY